jgi:hypothetical protein
LRRRDRGEKAVVVAVELKEMSDCT